MSRMQWIITRVVLLVALAPPLFAWAGVPVEDRAPAALVSECIQKWMHSYPDNLRAAALLTTEGFRGGKTPREWARVAATLVQSLAFHYVTGEIVSHQLHETDATVVVFVSVSTIWGVHEQYEQYELLRQDGAWRVHRLHVVDVSDRHMLSSRTSSR